MNAAVEAWISHAREDLDVARHAVSAGWYKTACFHAQQCGEKWMKALLILHGQSPVATIWISWPIFWNHTFMALTLFVRKLLYSLNMRWMLGIPID